MSLKILSIVNITPDSFSDGGKYLDPSQALAQIRELLARGSDFVDLGAESTRPGAQLISLAEEWSRLEPVLFALSPLELRSVSIDTSKAAIAHKAIELGVSFINDVSGSADPEMVDVCVQNQNVQVCVMHQRGLPSASLGESSPDPSQIFAELSEYFQARIDHFVSAGGKREKLILDPGFGFGKSQVESLEIFRRLAELKENFGLPVLVGLSRKRLAQSLWSCNLNDPNTLEAASLSLATLAVARGASYVRVHRPELYKPLQEIFGEPEKQTHPAKAALPD